MNSARLRQRLSVVYASVTLAGSRVFHASSAIRAFCAAVSAVKGGSGGRLILTSSFRGFRGSQAIASSPRDATSTSGDKAGYSYPIFWNGRKVLTRGARTTE